MTPYLSRMSGIRVMANNATARSESCKGIRHKLMSRWELSLVARGAGIRGEFSGMAHLLSPSRPAPVDRSDRNLESHTHRGGFGC
jgi:hypothetical protein